MQLLLQYLSQDFHKKDLCGSKIGIAGTNRHDFNAKILILMSVSVKKLTFDTFFIKWVVMGRKLASPGPKIIISARKK